MTSIQTKMIMKKTLIIGLVILSAVSCSKEQFQEKTTLFTVQAIIEDNATKTQISEADGRFAMEWSAGDSFTLYDGASLIVCNREGETSHFISDQTPVGDSFYAFYPASAVNSVDNGAFNVMLPSTMKHTAGNITPGQFPMSGHGSTAEIGFRNLCALVSIRLEADGNDNARQLSKVTLTADKPVCGEAQVAFGSDQLTITDGGNDLTIECDGISLADSPVMHFTVPVGKYNSFIIRIETTDSRYATLTINGPFELKRSMDYSTTLPVDSFYSPYVSTIIDVDLAPGQFINILPEDIETKESALAAIADCIVGKTDTYIHLGGWGGSVTVGFDHPIMNLDGSDFRAYGNAFEGSSEPGVLYVAQKDASGNPGKWYLIKHSMYDKAIHDYTITYYRPEAEEIVTSSAMYWTGTYDDATTTVVKNVFNKKATKITSLDPDPDVEWYMYNNILYKLDGQGSTAATLKIRKVNIVSIELTGDEAPDTYEDMPLIGVNTTSTKVIGNYIYWTDNLGHSGYECKNSYHSQSYWPAYAGETITITGEYLPTNSFDTSGSGTNYVQDAKWWGFPVNDKGFGQGAWGFVDNYANTSPYSTIDISWAVDEDGIPANLDHVDFVKVMSATHKQSGWIGEISTEFQGIEDLHLLNQNVTVDTSIVPSDVELVYWTY